MYADRARRWRGSPVASICIIIIITTTIIMVLARSTRTRSPALLLLACKAGLLLLRQAQALGARSLGHG